MTQNVNNRRTERQLLALVRAALWDDTAAGCEAAAEPVDWDAVDDTAARQTVEAAAAKGALSLPEGMRPAKERIHRHLAYMVRNSRTHSLVDSCLGEAAARLRDAGAEPVLLKGQAYARFYPDPTLRQCGDIDLYIGEENYGLACDTARWHGWEEREGENYDPKAKHFGCYLRGVRLELHRVAAQLPSAGADRRFRAWSREELAGRSSLCDIGGAEVRVPSPLFDAVFVFLHLYTHFIEGGVGLRQLCDWVMILHAHAGAIDREELRARLTDFGLMRAWLMFAPIAVEHLGLPEEEFPFYSTRYRGKAEKILALVMRDGNFGRYTLGRTARPEGYWRGKLHTCVNYPRRLVTLLPIAPGRIAAAFGNFLYKGTRHVIADKLHGRRKG